MSKVLRFETGEDAQNACDAMNVGKKTKHDAYRVEVDGLKPFYTVGRNAGEARSNAAVVLNVRVSRAETVGMLERIINLPAEELASLRAILLRNGLDPFLTEGIAGE